MICPNVSAEKSDLGTGQMPEGGGGEGPGERGEGSQSYFLESMSTLTPPRYRYPFTFVLQILHIMHTNTKRVQTTFVIDFDFCLGGRAQHRILACV